MSGKTLALLLLLTLFAASFLGAQSALTPERIPYNERYAYPFSIGAGFNPLSPLAGVDHRASVSDVSGRVRVPLPFLPVVQPFAVAGLESFDSDVADDPTVLGGVLDAGLALSDLDYDERAVWDHNIYYLGLGAGYAHRINKEFEVGAELFAGLSQSYFDRRVVTSAGEWYPIGELGLVLGFNGKISLNPSFNLSIDVVPSFRYQGTFGNLPDFDGLYFGVGFAAHYRFGQDPDAPQAEIRALQFAVDELPPVFAAMQKVYVDQPITYVTIANREDNEVTDLSVSFYQASYMDSPTPCAEIASILPGESVEVPLLAGFNEEVFATVDVVPLTGDIVVNYNYRGSPAQQSQSVTFNLQDRNSLTWDDDAKVGAFITPRDSAVLNYASFVANSGRNETTDYLPDPLETAIQVYHGLTALEIGYQADPTSPFAQVQGNSVFIDSVSLPRETLRRGTGDCDDITVLYNTLLESIGIETGIVTIPGHIYSAVNTGAGPRDWSRVHPDRNMTMVDGESLWVLVEITLIGQAGFMDAWRTGMEQWQQYDDNVAMRNFLPTAVCQEVYSPVGLRETDIGLQYGDPEDYLSGFRRDLGRLSGAILEPIREEAESRNRPRTWNHLGAVAAQLRDYSIAENSFSRAAQMDSDYLAPRINLGALYYLQGNYTRALNVLQDAESVIALGGASDEVGLAVYLNMARTLTALGRDEDSDEYYALAAGIDPEETSRYRFAASMDADGGRASSAANAPAALFVDEEE